MPALIKPSHYPLSVVVWGQGTQPNCAPHRREGMVPWNSSKEGLAIAAHTPGTWKQLWTDPKCSHPLPVVAGALPSSVTTDGQDPSCSH